MIIAIDGPAGSGKSTVAKGVAKKLGFLYIDTGAMYRAVTLKAIRLGVDLKNENALAATVDQANINLEIHQGVLKTFLDGEDVSSAIRTTDLTNKVFYIAKVLLVRERMVKLQRKLAGAADNAILEGRDIGTVVYPDADKKFFIDAKFDERVKRRYKELNQMGHKVSQGEIKNDLKKRDYSDKTRKVAPLKKADDALYVDTTEMSIQEVVDKLISEIKK